MINVVAVKILGPRGLNRQKPGSFRGEQRLFGGTNDRRLVHIRYFCEVLTPEDYATALADAVFWNKMLELVTSRHIEGSNVF